ALGLGLESQAVAQAHHMVGAVTVAVLVASGGTKAPAFEDQRVGIAAGGAALQHDADEAAAIEGGGGLSHDAPRGAGTPAGEWSRQWAATAIRLWRAAPSDAGLWSRHGCSH